MVNASVIAQKLIAHIERGPADPVAVLGEIAAHCDVYAADPAIKRSERMDLERRASRYRLQQLIELDRQQKVFEHE